MFNRFLLIIFVVLSPKSSFANGDTLTIPGTWSLGAKVQIGYLLAHRPSLVYLQQKKISSFEISYLKSSQGHDEWQRNYNEPLLGFAYQYFDLGNENLLGHGHAVYPLVLFPLLHKHHLGINIRFGIGIGYVEKRYTIAENYKNQAISTHINGVITTGIQFRIPCNARTQFSTGIDFTHFSNGASRLPNAGLNIPSINIGFQHFFGQQIKLIRTELPDYNHKKEITFYAATGFKERIPGETIKVSVGIFTTDIHFRITRKSFIGGGADVFYDATLQKRVFDLDSINYSKTAANTRIGIHFSYGIAVGKFRGYFQPGYYLYNKLPVSASIFTRLSLRYFVNEKIFVCFNLKSHFAKADYFEYGIGFKI